MPHRLRPRWYSLVLLLTCLWCPLAAGTDSDTAARMTMWMDTAAVTGAVASADLKLPPLGEGHALVIATVVPAGHAPDGKTPAEKLQESKGGRLSPEQIGRLQMHVSYEGTIEVRGHLGGAPAAGSIRYEWDEVTRVGRVSRGAPTAVYRNGGSAVILIRPEQDGAERYQALFRLPPGWENVGTEVVEPWLGQPVDVDAARERLASDSPWVASVAFIQLVRADALTAEQVRAHLAQADGYALAVCAAGVLGNDDQAGSAAAKRFADELEQAGGPTDRLACWALGANRALGAAAARGDLERLLKLPAYHVLTQSRDAMAQWPPAQGPVDRFAQAYLHRLITATALVERAVEQLRASPQYDLYKKTVRGEATDGE